MRILFAGTPQVAVPSLNELRWAGHEVAAVLTRADALVGRKKVLTPSPVAQAAAEAGLEIIKANRIDEPVVERLKALDLDAAAIVAYGGLVPPAALQQPRFGWINLHFSLLPAWRGAAPVQHALINGDDISGASTFLLEEGLDTGPVFGTVTEPVRSEDTSGVLLERLSQSGAVLLSQTLAALEQGRAVPVPQSGEVSLAPKLSSADGRIRWSDPALAIKRRISGVTPEPGAWTLLDGQRVKLGVVLLHPDIGEIPSGRVRERDGAVLVGTGSHAVQLTEVQPAGRSMLAAAEWFRGTRREDLIFE
ncbi:methionyl-tRNA formyltransferase [Arthrobacter sp. Soil782]|uniref:methionyl-tRNA formyltransferase n=1 Tax=Arthrobacter sp. Soil782 TaxID=1736410 RepID=UPI0006F28581|nr:methionyl-tRNA formyltransferase [Arthrobacter sp. Soil782]KRF04581.1 methionyl-tRNA formyltransferase [Arthrobacter sp. Soil782]